MNKNLRTFIEYLPILIAVILVGIQRQSEIMTAIILLVITVIAFLIRHDKNEWLVFIAGVILGTTVELFGDYFAKLQFWTQDTIFGIPLWLPIFWGIGFVYIRRIGNLIVGLKFNKKIIKQQKTK